MSILVSTLLANTGAIGDEEPVCIDPAAVPHELRSEDLADWLRLDAAAAMDWINSPPGQERHRTVLAALALTAAGHPELTIMAATRLAEGPRDEAVGFTLHLWLQNHRERATQWFATEATIDIKDRFASRFARWFADVAPSEALSWTQALPQRHARLAIRGVVDGMAARNLQDAVATLSVIHDEDVRAEGASSVLKRWVRAAPAER